MDGIESKDVAAAAILLAMTKNRQEEKDLIEKLKNDDTKAAAVDHGGEFNNCFKKVIEKSIVAAKREGVIQCSHIEEGAIAGATHDALSQLIPKAMGLNFGGKIAVAKKGEHLSVAIFCGVGLLHLNDVAIAVGHRAIGNV